jgi:hypothetical protein
MFRYLTHGARAHISPVIIFRDRVTNSIGGILMSVGVVILPEAN